MKIKFIYFDIGGVMLDFSDVFFGSTKKFNIPINELMEFWLGDNSADEMTRGKLIPQDFWMQAIKKFNLKNAEDFNFIESWMADYRPITAIHQLAKELLKKYKIGLISNIYPGMMPKLIELGMVADVGYSAVVLSYETGLRKPEKEIYKLATDLSGVKPEEILLIDDREDFLEGAKRYGWNTILFDPKNIDKTFKEINLMLD